MRGIIGEMLCKYKSELTLMADFGKKKPLLDFLFGRLREAFEYRLPKTFG